MLIETIAEEIERCGKTRYLISKETGIDQATLCRVVNGGSCGLKTMELLCEYLDLKLVKNRAGKRG